MKTIIRIFCSNITLLRRHIINNEIRDETLRTKEERRKQKKGKEKPFFLDYHDKLIWFLTR